jgi:hypothetical protein
MICEVIHRFHDFWDPLIDFLLSDSMTDRTIDLTPYHLDDIGMDISSIDDLPSAGVDRETMVIEYVIILEHVFSHIEVPTLDLLLDGRDVPHEHLALDEWISLRMRLEACENRE